MTSTSSRRTDLPHPGDGVPALLADLATSVLAIKEGDLFLCTDRAGNVDDRREYGLGLYHRDTRFLSRFRLSISGRAPVLLSSSADRVFLSHVDLTNPEIEEGGEVTVPQQTLNLRRSRVVDGRLIERVRARNYHSAAVEVVLSYSLAADFADIFEVRGMRVEDPTPPLPPEAGEGVATFRRRGRDGVERRTEVRFEPPPERLVVDGDRVEADFRLRVPAKRSASVVVTVDPMVGAEVAEPRSFDAAIHRVRRRYDEWDQDSTHVTTDNELFNQLVSRGLRDLRGLETPVEGGRILAAGIPWYVAVFGRDSLLAAHQMLSVSTVPARDTLRLLARHQGQRDDPWRDEEPGKILHEIRRGELAGAGEIPHTPYYGTADATPLFVILFAQYVRWTGDLDFARELLPNVQAALRWIDEWGDRDGDGFVEYLCRSPMGIRNQGWKDSFDAVVHADGTLAEGAIAMSEVQGYVHMAKDRVAGVFDSLGLPDVGTRLRAEAALLKERFNEAFWMPHERYFAEALDGDKRQVQTVTSNPGHGLYCDIVDQEKAGHLARRLLGPDLFSGWGIRTMSKDAAAYNPMSYHNGSVWPHDNALIAAGLKRYGFVRETNRVATALFDAAVNAEYLRLPELFCGFTRRTPNRPVGYPVACSPQAWAAGSPLLLLQAILGISARAQDNLLTVNKPHLPPWLNTVELRNLRVGESAITLVFRREAEITAFSLLDRRGDVRVVLEE